MSPSQSSNNNKSTTLELLPNELQCQILKSTQNLKILHNLIRASAQYLSVFRASRESIISHVAWNSITPTVVPIALHALEQRDQRIVWRSRTSGTFSASHEWQQQQKQQEKQQQQKTTTMTFKGPDDIPFKTWERLISFHRIVDSFITDFACSRLAALENSFELQSCQSPLASPPKEFDPEDAMLDLSQVEYGRLARAFYRLDLFANLFYDIDTRNMTYNQTYIAFSDRSVPFMKSLRGWEVDELLCVRSYIFEGLKNFLNQFEDEFMETFLEKAPRIDWPVADTIDLENDKRAILFSEKGYRLLQEPWLEKCLARGLTNLSRMLFPSSSSSSPSPSSAATTFRDDFILLGADRFLPFSEYFHAPGQPPSVFMSDALNMIQVCSKWWLEDEETNPLRDEDEDEDEDKRPRFYEFRFRRNNDIDKPNEAWSWAMNNYLPRTSRTWPGRDNHDAECWAYVIWDYERLERLGLITKT